MTKSIFLSEVELAQLKEFAAFCYNSDLKDAKRRRYENLSKDQQKKIVGKLFNLAPGTANNNFLTETPTMKLHAESFDFFCTQFKKILAKEIDLKEFNDEREAKRILFERWEKSVGEKIKSIPTKGGGSLEYKKDIFESETPNKKFPFAETFWSLYETFDEKIIRRTLLFKSTKSKITCPISLKPYQDNVSDWVGEASLIENGSSLAITAVNQNSKCNYTHIILEIDNKTPEPVVFIGQITFCSDTNHNIYTKQILIHKGESLSEKAKSEIFEFDSPDVPKGIAEFLKSVAPSVYSFRHPLSIFDLDSLQFELNEKAKGKSDYLGR